MAAVALAALLVLCIHGWSELPDNGSAAESARIEFGAAGRTSRGRARRGINSEEVEVDGEGHHGKGGLHDILDDEPEGGADHLGSVADRFGGGGRLPAVGGGSSGGFLGGGKRGKGPSRAGVFLRGFSSPKKPPAFDTARTLSFEVCPGFGNQRLSIVHGIVMAKLLRRTPVMPILHEFSELVVPFEDVFDIEELRKALAPLGMQALTIKQHGELNKKRGSVTVDLGSRKPIDDVPKHFKEHDGVPHISLDCPLYKLSRKIVSAERGLFFDMLEALRPAAALRQHVDKAVKRVGSEEFNFLHLRIEKDWQTHCKRLDAAGHVDTVIGAQANCFNNTMDVDRVLTSMGFEKDVPLYVASDWASADQAVVEEVTDKISAAGYSPVLSKSPAGLTREVAAQIEFDLAVRAKRFLGNSLSAFSALAIMQRRNGDLWAAHYNGGDIPMLAALPLTRTPWVFTYSSWGSASRETMVKAAVRSAAKQGHLAAYCVFAGNSSAPIVKWMAKRGVHVLHFQPDWRERLIETVRAHRAKADPAAKVSNAAQRALVAAWQHIDLPLVPWINQYTHVLLTDADVVFRRSFDFSELPRPLPSVAATANASTVADLAGGELMLDGDVAIVNLPALRETYEKFSEFVLSDAEGLMLHGFGEAKQSAYHAFYGDEATSWPIPPSFSARPFDSGNVPYDVAIISFLGPNPYDYMQFAATGACKGFPHKDVCRAGVSGRGCQFAKEWIKFLEKRDQVDKATKLWREGCGGKEEALENIAI